MRKSFYFALLLIACLFASCSTVKNNTAYNTGLSRPVASGKSVTTGTSGFDKGYRGMVEVNNSLNHFEDYMLIFSTTHGYQISPIIFVGGVLKYSITYPANGGSSNIFSFGADFRKYFRTNTLVKPYFGIQGGISRLNHYRVDHYYDFSGQFTSVGPFVQGSIGLSYPFSQKLALTVNLNVGGDACDTPYGHYNAGCLLGIGIGLEF